MLKAGIIILSRNRSDLLRQCLDRLRTSLNGGSKSSILVWDNSDLNNPGVADLCKEYGVKRLGGTGENVSFAKANNEAAKLFKGDVLLLNDDCLIQPGCLEAMATMRAEGCDIVGAKLLYPNGTIQHYGVGFSREYWPFHIGRHQPLSDPYTQEDRITVAVTGALMWINRTYWDQLGGLDEEFVFGYEDIDLCLRAHEIGAVCGVATAAVGLHLESQTAGRSSFDPPNMRLFQKKWVDTSRIYHCLGLWPIWIRNALDDVRGPDMALMGQMADGD